MDHIDPLAEKLPMQFVYPPDRLSEVSPAIVPLHVALLVLAIVAVLLLIRSIRRPASFAEFLVWNAGLVIAPLLMLAVSQLCLDLGTAPRPFAIVFLRFHGCYARLEWSARCFA